MTKTKYEKYTKHFTCKREKASALHTHLEVNIKVHPPN